MRYVVSMIWHLMRYTLCPYSTLFRSFCVTRCPLSTRRQASGRSSEQAVRALQVTCHDWQSHDLQVAAVRSEEHTSELQSPCHLVFRLLIEITIIYDS